MSTMYDRPRPAERASGVVVHAARLACAGLALFAGCGDDDGTTDPTPDPEPPSVATVEVTPGTATITAIGDTHQFSARAKDADGNDMDDVTFVWESSDSTVATVDTTGLTTARAAGEATITATAEDVPGNATVVVDQAIADLGYRTQPSTTAAGEAMSPAVEVEVRDSAGSVVGDAAIPITLELADTSDGARLLGTTTVTSANGVASFSGLSIERADTARALVATSPGVPEATSASFAVTPLDAVGLAYLSAPSDTTAGEPLDVRVAFRDEFGNVATSATEMVTIALEQNPGGAALTGSTTATAADGVAHFDDVAIERADAGYTLEATAQDVDSIVSPPFTIRPAAPDHIGIVATAAPGGLPEQPITGLEYGVEDAFENFVDTATASMTVTLSSPAFPGTAMDGRSTASTVDGVAVFDSVLIDKPGKHEVVVSSMGLGDAADTVYITLFPSVNLQVDAGGVHTCTPTSTGPFCWGWNGSDQLGNPSTSIDSVAVPANSDLTFTLVSAGAAHTCGTTSAADGDDIYCWGANDHGQLGLGNGVGAPITLPTAVQDPIGRPTSYYWLDAGDRHTCAVGSDASAYCWGDNAQGQIGIGSTGTDVDSLTLVTDSLPFFAIAAGGSHTCALGAADSLAYCWGANDRGQLGDDNMPTGSPSPVQVIGSPKYIYIDAGRTHTCAVEADTGDVDCWGANDLGQLGDGNQGTDSDTPVPTTATVLLASGGSGYNAFGRLAVGSDHACVVAVGPGGSAGGIECWGDNLYGQLGTGGTGVESDVSVPVDMSAFDGADPSPPMVWWWVGAGDGHSCAFEFDPNDAGGLYIQGLTGYYCWGHNGSGQLGNGTTSDAPTPVRPVQGH